MRIKVTKPSRFSPDDDLQYDFIIQQDDWNDYSYATMYHLYLGGKHSPDKEVLYIGSLKIIKKGQVNDNKKSVSPGEFLGLDNDFCSVGGTLDYYERLAGLSKDLKSGILTSLRDFTTFNYVKEGFKEESVWVKSIMRDMNEDDDIFTLPIFILKNNYDLIPSVDLQFSFSYDEALKPLIFDFKVKSFGRRSSQSLPGRLSVLVGRNGSGKSMTLARLSKVAFSSTTDRQTTSVRKTGIIKPEGLGFPKIINVSYSAFDSFQIPGLSYKEKLRLKKDIKNGRGRYIFCGIRDVVSELDLLLNENFNEDDDIKEFTVDRQHKTILKSIDVISEEFESIISTIFKNRDKLGLFDDVMELLKEDLSFSNIAEELYKHKRKNTILDYFSTLSTGHKFVLHSLSNIILHIQKRALVLFDEPETYLHPPLLAVLMSALRYILSDRDAFAIIATHSPVIIQETLGDNVNIISRVGDMIDFKRPAIETFGENLSMITTEVFFLNSNATDYHKVLDVLIEWAKTKEKKSAEQIKIIEGCFSNGLSSQARAYVFMQLAKEA